MKGSEHKTISLLCRLAKFIFSKYNNFVHTFFLSSGLPFLTVATIMSPEAAAGSLLRRPLMPCTAITYRFFAPEIVFNGGVKII